MESVEVVLEIYGGKKEEWSDIFGVSRSPEDADAVPVEVRPRSFDLPPHPRPSARLSILPHPLVVLHVRPCNLLCLFLSSSENADAVAVEIRRQERGR